MLAEQVDPANYHRLRAAFNDLTQDNTIELQLTRVNERRFGQIFGNLLMNVRGFLMKK